MKNSARQPSKLPLARAKPKLWSLISNQNPECKSDHVRAHKVKHSWVVRQFAERVIKEAAENSRFALGHRFGDALNATHYAARLQTLRRGDRRGQQLLPQALRRAHRDRHCH